MQSLRNHVSDTMVRMFSEFKETKAQAVIKAQESVRAEIKNKHKYRNEAWCGRLY